MEIITYILLAALVVSILFLIWCASILIKLDKENPDNIVIHTADEIKLPLPLSNREINHALKTAYQTDKMMAKMRSNRHRIIYS